LKNYSLTQKEIKIQYKLLKLISRSFSIPINFLSRPIRFDICNAYLIFRLADIIEDLTDAKKNDRALLYRLLAEALSTPEKAGLFKSQLQASLNQDVSLATIKLIEHADLVIRLYGFTSSYNRKIFDSHLDAMTNVMLQYDRDLGHDRISTASDLNHYAWGVAGNVGEYLHDLFFLYHYQSESTPKSKKQASQIGVGLQLVNIVMDINSDKKSGYSWFPSDDLTTDESNSKILRSMSKIRVDKIAKQAIDNFSQGEDYLMAINFYSFRVKFFILFPVQLAKSILNKLLKINEYNHTRQIKPKRWQVYMMIAIVMLKSISISHKSII
jgi:phytoene/squalene synthetase